MIALRIAATSSFLRLVVHAPLAVMAALGDGCGLSLARAAGPALLRLWRWLWCGRAIRQIGGNLVLGPCAGIRPCQLAGRKAPVANPVLEGGPVANDVALDEVGIAQASRGVGAH